jgi:DHA2 family multidrug resistance protein-like MFS transporter
MNLVAMFAVVGFAIFTTQYLQSVLGMSPMTAALWSLVPSVGIGCVAPLTGVLVQKFDRAYVAAVGFLTAVAGFGVLTQAHPQSHLWVVMVGAGVYASGLVIVMTVGSELIMGAVPPERAGAAAAVVETGSEFGGALGMAVLGSIGTAIYRSDLAGSAPHRLPPGALSTARDTLGGAVTVSRHLSGPTGSDLLAAARASFTHGMNVAAVGAGIMMVIAAVLSAAFLRGVQVEPPAALAEPTDQPEVMASTV